MKSMTAYAQYEHTYDWGEVIWEIRSVNQRYLEISFRWPEQFKSMEDKARNQVKKYLARGKVELSLSLKSSKASTKIELDTDRLTSLTNAINQIQLALPEATQINPLDVLNWPGLLMQPQEVPVMAETLMHSLQQALIALNDARSREGLALKKLIAHRCSAIETLLSSIQQTLPDQTRQHLFQMQQRVLKLVDELEPQRYQQEVAILAQKMDISEELDRLATHLTEVHRLIEQEDVIGRRLDFLMQELNREANTLGAKAFNTELSQASVEIKVFIEQMREQIQNIE